MSPHRGARHLGAGPLRTALLLLLALSGWGCAAMTDVSRLESEVRRLQEQVEELQKRNAEAQVRLQELREKRDTPPAVAAPPAAAQAAGGPLEKPPAGASPNYMYNTAFTQYNIGQHLEAVRLFRTMLEAHPRHHLADNAQYWIGECYFARKEYEQAAEEFQRVPEEYPQGNKVPDAFFKKALALLALERREEALEALRTVVEAYPKSDAAAQARQRLASLERGGRGASRR